MSFPDRLHMQNHMQNYNRYDHPVSAWCYRRNRQTIINRVEKQQVLIICIWLCICTQKTPGFPLGRVSTYYLLSMFSQRVLFFCSSSSSSDGTHPRMSSILNPIPMSISISSMLSIVVVSLASNACWYRGLK